MDGNELKREYENYRMLMYSGGYDPVTFEEWQGIMYPVEPPVNWRARAERAEAALRAIMERMPPFEPKRERYQDGEDYARLRAWWRAGEIARKVLEGSE